MRITIAWVALAVMALGTRSAAACECVGESGATYEDAGEEHKSGNGDLFWTSERFRVRARPNEQGWVGRFCYRQRIENHRADVLAYPQWEVAGLRRAASIPAGHRLCLSLRDPEPRDSAPLNGEIRYGSRGDIVLQTPDVYGPVQGFREGGPGLLQPLRPPSGAPPLQLPRPVPPAVNSSVEARWNGAPPSGVRLNEVLEPLVSDIVLQRSDGSRVFAIRVTSGIDVEGRLSLSIANQGETSTLVAINMSVTERQRQELAALPLRRDNDFRRIQEIVAFNAQPGASITLLLQREGGLTAEFSAVQIRSAAGEILMIVRIPLYVSRQASPLVEPSAFVNALRGSGRND